MRRLTNWFRSLIVWRFGFIVMLFPRFFTDKELNIVLLAFDPYERDRLYRKLKGVGDGG